MGRLSPISRVKLILLAIFIIIVFGTFMYMLIEGFSFMDALYMTIITVFTVGYDEVGGSISQTGMVFTIILIVISWATFAFAVSIITTYLIGGEISLFIYGRKTKSNIKKMKNHVIVCGFGRNGKQAIRELILHKKNFVVVDNNKDIMINNAKISSNYVVGDATDDEILIEAGIMKASALITTFPNDADNLFVVITAKSLNEKIKIISRGSSESSERKLLVAGANNVVMPEQVGGSHMASLVMNPDAVDFLSYLSVHGLDHPNLEEITCDNPSFNTQNKTIGELGIRSKTGANIVGFKTIKGEYIINPSSDTIIYPGAKIFVLANPEQVSEMKNLLREIN